jgi:lipopolysaccharide transport system permease protein
MTAPPAIRSIQAAAPPGGLARAFLHHANPAVFIPALWRHRYLIGQLTWREVTGRYRSSALGFAWSFVTPIVMLALYTFVFGVVFKARWPGAVSGNLSEFGLTLFAGLTTFSVFSECVNRAPSLITSSPNYVKKVVFPLEVLALSVLGSALFHAGISFMMLLIAHQFIIGVSSWTIVLIPLMLIPVSSLALGVSWVVASLGVFLRDIGHTVTLATQVLFFITPIFYSADALPERFRPVLALNPLAAMVDNARRVTVLGLPPSWQSWAWSVLIGGAAMCLGHAWFHKTKRAFADVI